MPDDEPKREWVRRVLGVGATAPTAGDGAEDAPDDAEDGGSVFVDPEAYQPYLRKRLAQLRTKGQAGFGIVLGGSGEEHRMALHPNKQSRALAAGLVRETGLHATTWGSAEPDPDRATTMRLDIEGRRLGGLKKKAELMLHAFAPLPFSKVALYVGGQEVEDLESPGEAADETTPRALAGLPADPGLPTPQAAAFIAAAKAGTPLCEECSLGPA
jgi:hypothetical protein